MSDRKINVKLFAGAGKKLFEDKLREQLESPLNMMDQIHTRLAVDMAKKWEETVKDVFFRRTGDTLTLENMNRVEIIKVLNDPNEYYHIDGKLAITLYPIELSHPLADEMYKITVARNYKEHEI